MKHFLGIDVGHKRVGLAVGDSDLRMARPLKTIAPEALEAVIQAEGPFDNVIVGLPRNLAGADTPQTIAVRRYADDVLGRLRIEPVFQDEAATSQLAEERLKAAGRAYAKADIDAEAAAIILQDYLDGL